MSYVVCSLQILFFRAKAGVPRSGSCVWREPRAPMARTCLPVTLLFHWQTLLATMCRCGSSDLKIGPICMKWKKKKEKCTPLCTHRGSSGVSDYLQPLWQCVTNPRPFHWHLHSRSEWRVTAEATNCPSEWCVTKVNRDQRPFWQQECKSQYIFYFFYFCIHFFISWIWDLFFMFFFNWTTPFNQRIKF